jgi:hypothetical protein
MSMRELPVVAEGETSRGQHWYLKAGGSPYDYYTMLKTVHPDGRWDEGGMGGSALHAGSLFNAYTGRADDGPLRVIVRTDPRVRRLRFHSAKDEWCDLLPVGDDPAVGVTFFAALLPWTAAAVSMRGFDADGQELWSRTPSRL